MFKTLTKKEFNNKKIIVNSYPNQIVHEQHLDGTDIWYLRGLIHRETGPAVEKPMILKSGLFICKEWRFKGTPHRLDGPAIEYPWERKWYFKGFCYKTASKKNPDNKWIYTWRYQDNTYPSYEKWLLAFNEGPPITVLKQDKNQKFIKILKENLENDLI